MIDIMPEKDLRGNFGTVRDQGSRPTCLAFAVSDAHAAMRGPWDPLSCEYLFYQAVQRAGSHPDNGATLTHLLAALHNDGQPSEAGWPYLTSVPKDLALWAPPANIVEVFRRTSESRTPTFDDVRRQVAAGVPVVLVLTLSQAFYFVTADGIIDVDEPVDPANRHAVVAVASGRAGKTRFLLIRNSWGREWALEGHAWLSERYLSPRIVNGAHLKEIP